jgi:oligoendopeptidase F
MQNSDNNQYKWDLTPLLLDESEENFNKLLSQIEERNYIFINKWKEREDYLMNPSILKEALDEYDKLDSEMGLTGNIGYYYSLKESLDQSNADIKARLNKIEDVAVKISNDVQFFTHKLAKVSVDTQNIFLNYPELGDYKHFLEQLFIEAKYLLPENEEKIINLISSSAYSSWVRMTSDFISREERQVLDSQGNKTVKTFAEISELINDQNKTVRDNAAIAFNDILAKHVDTAENEINAILQHKKVMDNLRGFTRPDQGRHLADDIPTDVVDTMLQTVSAHYDISTAYYKKKAELLGQEKLAYHERNVQVGEIGEKIYTFEESIEIVRSVFGKLDSEFLNIFDSFLKNRQIDVFPQKGKSNGAFCTHNLKTQPTYVLLNFTGRIRDIATIAHEMGHAINNELSRKYQNSLNFGTFISTAEVASTFFEDFVFDEISKELDAKTKTALEMTRQGDFISTVQRQVACYKFEQELHREFREKGYLAKNDIGKIFQKHMSAYMGPYVELSEGSENWWVYWSHIRNFFYVYSYASGLLISRSMQVLVRKDPTFINKVKTFLSAGTSKSPVELFAQMGIDITTPDFWLIGLN